MKTFHNSRFKQLKLLYYVSLKPKHINAAFLLQYKLKCSVNSHT